MQENSELRNKLKTVEHQLNQLGRESEAIKGISQSKPIQHPHDTGYKSLLSRKTIFLQLLKRFLPHQWVKGLDEASLVNINKSFILHDFRKKELDIIYMAKIMERDVIIYCLMELQSTVDHLMPLRLLIYKSNAWNDIVENMPEPERRSKAAKIPLIIPIVLYNGADPWDAPLNFRDIIDLDPLFLDMYDDTLNFTYKLINVQSYSEEELLSNPEIISMIFWLDQVKEPAAIFHRIKKLAGVISLMVIEEYRILAGWIEHIVTRNLKEKEKRAVHNLIKESKPVEVEEMISNVERVLEMHEKEIIRKTWEKAEKETREKTEKETWERAEKETWERANREMAKALLKENPDIDFISRVTGLEPAQILKLQNSDQ